MPCPGKYIGTIGGNRFYKSRGTQPYCYTTKGGQAFGVSNSLFAHLRSKHKAWKVSPHLTPAQRARKAAGKSLT